MNLLIIHFLISLGTLLVHENIEGMFWSFFKSCMQMLLGGPLIDLLFVWSYCIEYGHNNLIGDFSIFGI